MMSLRVAELRERLGPWLRRTLSEPSDRLILSVFFLSLFGSHYGVRLLYMVARAPGVSPIQASELLGFGALAFVAKGMDAQRELRGFDFALLSLASLALIHPWWPVGDVVLTIIGLRFLFSQSDRLVSLGRLCIGLAWVGLWGQVILRSFLATWLLPVEAAVSYVFLQPFGDFTLVDNGIIRPDGHGVVMYSGCSAFRNTITAAFLWLCLIEIQERAEKKWNLAALTAALAAVVLLNCVRIALMARSAEALKYWHDGNGATIIATVMLAAVAGTFLISQSRNRIAAR